MRINKRLGILILFISLVSGSPALAQIVTFSMSPPSFSVISDGPAPLRVHRAGDLLQPSGLGDEAWQADPGPGPDIQVQAAMVLLLDPQIAGQANIDALSATHPLPVGNFYLGFSVDRMNSVGNGKGGPYHVNHQMNMIHHEGDIFYALPGMKIGQIAPTPDNGHIHPGGTGSTHSFDPNWISNQTMMDIAPRFLAHQQGPNDIYDDLDAAEFKYFADTANAFPSTDLYCSVDEWTATNIPQIPGITGGDILIRTQFGLFLWADHIDLGLLTLDDLDALVVFGDQDGQYGPGDVVLFSLAPGSESLFQLGVSAADVLVAHYQAAPTVFAPADDIGLLFTDNLDALVPIFSNAVFFSTLGTVQPISRTRIRLWNHPNPFNPRTTISIELPLESTPQTSITLDILDLKGSRLHQVFSGDLGPGIHSFPWDGNDWNGNPASSGTYFYLLMVNGREETGKMTLIR